MNTNNNTMDPTLPGVYAISGNNPYNTDSAFALYIGSSTNPFVRFETQHKPALENNSHKNKNLQIGWNQNNDYQLVPLETVTDISKLPEREVAWQITYDEQNALLNLRISGTPGMRGKKHSEETKHKMSLAKSGDNHPDTRKEYTFVSPEGKRFDVKGLKAICDKFELNPSHMSKIARGKQIKHRGWTALSRNN